MSVSINTGYHWELARATAAAEALIKRLQPACQRIEIAGSIRRGAASVKDVELVAIPITREKVIAGQMSLFGNDTAATVEVVSQLDQKLEWLAAEKVIYKDRPGNTGKGLWGDKLKKFWISWPINGQHSYIAVDLFIVTPPAQWGPIMTIRTGPADFGKQLMVWVLEAGYQQKDGRLIEIETGEVMTTPEEADYFKALGLRWVEPGKRSVNWLKDETRFNRVKEAQEKAKRKRLQEQFEALSAPVEQGEQVSDPTRTVDQPGIMLSTQIKALLGNMPGIHPTVIGSMLGCDGAALRLVIDSLIALGDVERNRFGGLALVGKSATAQRKSATVADLGGGILYTGDQDVRDQIRARIEGRIKGRVYAGDSA